MVQYAELRVTSLAVQVKLTVGLSVEVDTPADQVLYLCGRHGYHLLHRLGVADVVAGYHSVLDMLLKVIRHQIGYRGYSPLGEISVSLVERCLAYHANLSLMCPRYLERITHTSHTRADDEKIVLVNHNVNYFGTKLVINPQK